ncbi:hypothetical protein CCUS01_12860 [Colletotrichum cuscutae]|uniref:Uncharacterized protein n=1 Tax=Colletotrichum cuscutae TaxID=1209917 RepID=A0AAJ0DQF0_9PEZI|nr:hypothetical protein CCUS01_12860 [Colletotrichum cuscutae]
MYIPRKPLNNVANTSMAPEYTVNVHSQPLHQSQTAYSASNTKPIDESTTETTSLTSNRAKPKKSKVATSEYSWTLEIWALVLSIAALITATALLSAYDGKPLSKWAFFFTFNTIISILGTVSRVSLAFGVGACLSQGKWNLFRRKDDYMISYDRFEEAGRGPLGSARLLWHIKHRHWVSLGALATVVLLGFEPFLQAVVEFYEKEVDSSEVDAVASIGTTRRLDVGKAGFSGDTPLQSIQMPEPYTAVSVEPVFLEYDFGSLSAIWTGFNNLSTPSSQQPSFTCATGNCTWAPHLVMSTGIADASDKALTVPWSMQNARLNTSDKFAYTKFELPTMNLNISNFDDGSGQQVELTAQTTTQPGDTLSFQDTKALIVSFAMMKAKMNAAGEKEKAPGASALECALSFCTNIYRSTVTKGILKEEVLGSYSVRNLDSFSYALSSSPKTAEKIRVYNKMSNYTLDFHSVGDMRRTDLQLTLPSDDDVVASMGQEDELWFNISQAAAATVSSAFVEKFARRSGSLALKQLVYPTFELLEPEQPSVISTLGTSQNLSSTFEIAALGMTKWMRDVSFQTAPHRGTTRESVVHIRVRWAFISLPFGALLGGCLFCLFSMVETRRLRLPAWKGSSLAGLTHALDAEAREQLRGAEDISKHAKQVKIRMVESMSGPELALFNSSDPANKVGSHRDSTDGGEPRGGGITCNQ